MQVDHVRQETLLKLCEARPREEKQTAESGLMDALACLRAMRARVSSLSLSLDLGLESSWLRILRIAYVIPIFGTGKCVRALAPRA